MRVGFTPLVMVLALLSPVAGSAQADSQTAQEKLGTVTFSTSCSSAVQSQFNRAVALMHSFQFARAIDAFHAVLLNDPSCSMAYWGIALSNWGNPFASGQKPQAQLEQGLKAVEQARAVKPKPRAKRTSASAKPKTTPARRVDVSANKTRSS